jgi:hypothetical protein
MTQCFASLCFVPLIKFVLFAIYHNNLVTSTQNYNICRNVKFFKNIFCQISKFLGGKLRIFWIIQFFDMEFSKFYQLLNKHGSKLFLYYGNK